MVRRTCNSPHHNGGRTLFDVTVSCSMDEIYNILFTPSVAFVEALKSQGVYGECPIVSCSILHSTWTNSVDLILHSCVYTLSSIDISVGLWQPPDENGERTRTTRFTAPVCGPGFTKIPATQWLVSRIHHIPIILFTNNYFERKARLFDFF
jgi:hypothetical protein